MIEELARNFAENGLNILLVEDDEGDAKAVLRGFRKAKISNPLYRAVDGVDALNVLRGNGGRDRIPSPHIIVTDMQMPRMDGIGLIEEIRRDPRLKRSIVFVLTTSKSDEDKYRAYELNVAGYIVKEAAGRDFLKLVEMLGSYGRVVELPDGN